MSEEISQQENQQHDVSVMDAEAMEEMQQPAETAVVAEIETADVLEENELSLPAFQVVPYHERYYLKYCEGKRSIPMDLEGTRMFLQKIGFDGGELRQARKGRVNRNQYEEKSKNNQMYCSYCGTDISGVEFHRMQDGRMRCTTCSSTTVKTKAEMEQLCQRVISNMEKFFGASINVPVSIELAEEQKLKKKVDLPLGTKDDQSILVLGASIHKDKKYKILLENGAPRISLIATFAHELTHIWQFVHWDNQKVFQLCPPSKRILIYEGMAKWAEIQYLYLIGETNVARREEAITRRRQDAYGLGFCLYEERYPLSREVMSCEDSPFTLDRYPL